MDFKNKVVLITGGCSGIGKIMARKSLERGCQKLVIWDINEDGLAKTKEEFSNLKLIFPIWMKLKSMRSAFEQKSVLLISSLITPELWSGNISMSIPTSRLIKACRLMQPL